MPRIWAGRSETYKYTDDDRKWAYGGRSSYFARFKAHSNMATLQAAVAAADH